MKPDTLRKTSPMLSVIAFMAATLTTTLTVHASGYYYYIKDVMVIGGTKTEVNNFKTNYQAQGWMVINQDLNAGCGGSSDYIYLLFKGDATADENVSYITDFYIKQGSTDVSNELIHNGRVYHLAAYDGGNHFKSQKGDLNSNAGGDCIHLYYTRGDFSDNRIVTRIYFDDTQLGALGKNGVAPDMTSMRTVVPAPTISTCTLRPKTQICNITQP